ncbi:helix-turn-helix domain-containing protein [Neobacillus sp. Marseille-QA0830]
MDRIPRYLSIDVTEVIKATELDYEAGNTLVFKNKDCLLLLYVKSGCTLLQANGEAFSLSDNQLFIIKLKGNASFLRIENNARVISILFRATSDIIDQITNRSFTIERGHKTILDSVGLEIEAIDFLKKQKPSMTYDKEIGEYFNLTSSLLYSFLTQVLLLLTKDIVREKLPDSITQSEMELLSRSDSQKPMKEKSTNGEINYKNPLVHHIIDYMKNNLDKNFTIDELAQEFFVGSANLKKIFKKETDLSIMTFFKNLKMETALMWIRQNELSYTEIAERLGFYSIHHFSAAFKKYTGYSPSKFYQSLKPGYVEKVNDIDRIRSHSLWF